MAAGIIDAPTAAAEPEGDVGRGDAAGGGLVDAGGPTAAEPLCEALLAAARRVTPGGRVAAAGRDGAAGEDGRGSKRVGERRGGQGDVGIVVEGS